MGVVKLMVKEIRKTMIVRVDVVDEDELMMAYSKGQSKKFDGRKVGIMGKWWRSL